MSLPISTFESIPGTDEQSLAVASRQGSQPSRRRCLLRKEPEPETVGVLPPVLATLLGAPDVTSKEAAWAAFLDCYTGLLLQTAYSLTRTYDAAMDGYTFVLEQLRRNDFLRLRGFAADGPSRFSTWLAVVARRLCLDRARQHYGRTRGVREDDGKFRAARAMRRRLADLVVERIDVTCLTDYSTDPEAALTAAERSRALAAVLQRLSVQDHLLLKLRFEKDLPAREIADLMGLASPFHVYRRLKLLLASVRRALQQAGIEEASL